METWVLLVVLLDVSRVYTSDREAHYQSVICSPTISPSALRATQATREADLWVRFRTNDTRGKIIPGTISVASCKSSNLLAEIWVQWFVNDKVKFVFPILSFLLLCCVGTSIMSIEFYKWFTWKERYWNTNIVLYTLRYTSFITNFPIFATEVNICLVLLSILYNFITINIKWYYFTVYSDMRIF